MDWFATILMALAIFTLAMAVHWLEDKINKIGLNIKDCNTLKNEVLQKKEQIQKILDQ